MEESSKSEWCLTQDTVKERIWGATLDCSLNPSYLVLINDQFELFVFSNKTTYNYFLTSKSSHACKKAMVYKATLMVLLTIDTTMSKRRKGIAEQKEIKKLSRWYDGYREAT